MSENKCPCDNPYSIFGISSKISPKELKRKYKKLLKYHPNRSPKSSNKAYEKECKEKYNKYTTLLHSAKLDLENNTSVNSEEVESCKSIYKKELNKYSFEELLFILSENGYPTTGNEFELKQLILDNIPYRVAKINVWQMKYKVDIESEEIKIKLNELTDNQLQFILENNNIKSYGDRNELIEKILENFSVAEIKNIIDELPLYVENALNKVYELIGKTDFTQSFKNRLKKLCLTENHGRQVKESLIKSINNYSLTQQNVENEMHNLLQIKSKEVEAETLNYLYQITGANSLSFNFTQKLESNHLSTATGLKIRNTLISLIKSKQITQNEIETKIDELINQKVEEINEIIKKVYEIIGKTEFTLEYQNMLKNLGLTEKHGQEIKNSIISSIYSLEINKNQVEPEIHKRLQLKSQEIEKETLNYLYTITGEKSLSVIFIQILDYNKLPKKIGFEIRKTLIDLIKSKQITQDEIEAKIEELINAEVENINEMLQKAYDLIGKNEFSEYFMNLLNENGLSEKHGLEIKDKTIELIYNLEVSKDAIESKILELVQLKSEEAIQQSLNYLFQITGDNSLSISYFNKLKSHNLSKTVGFKIKSNLINLIISKEITQDRIDEKIDELINIEVEKNRKQKLKILYSFTGEKQHSKSYLKLLYENELSEETGLEIKDEIIDLINNDDIDDESIILQLKESIRLKGIYQYLNKREPYQLNQIAILHKIKTSKIKEDQIHEIINYNLPKEKLQQDLDKIIDVESKLSNLTDKQLHYIIHNNFSKDRSYSNLIEEILSNIPLKFINFYLNDIKGISLQIDGLRDNEINYILKLNSLTTSKNRKNNIDEIHENIDLNDLKISLKAIDDLKNKLMRLYSNEIKYIADLHGFDKNSAKMTLIYNLLDNVDLFEIENNIYEVYSIEKKLNSFNRMQIKHLLIMNNLEYDGGESVKFILKNLDLNKILEMEKTIINVENELKSLNQNQLEYILYKHKIFPIKITTSSIDIIMQSLLISVILKDLNDLDDIKKQLNSLNNGHLKNILDENNLESKDDKHENIETILENIPINEIINRMNFISNEISKNLVYLYTITGKFQIKSQFLKELEQYNLDEEDGIEIRQILENEIKIEILNEKTIKSRIEEELIKKSHESSNDLDYYLAKLKDKELDKKQHQEYLQKTLKIIANSNFTSIIEIKGNQKIIKPINTNGLKLFILFSDEIAYTEFINKHEMFDISKLIKPAKYYVDIAKNTNNVDGLLFKTSSNTFILQKKLFKILEKNMSN